MLLKNTIGNLIVAGGLMVSAIGLAQAETAQQAAVKALDGFKAVPDHVGEVYKDPMELVKKFRSYGFSLEEDSQDLVIRWERSRWLDGDIARVVTLDVEATGFADDSVKGQRIRHILASDGEGGYRVMASGTQYTCWRGGNKDKWTDGLCS